jgi:hypothetical protein
MKTIFKRQTPFLTEHLQDLSDEMFEEEVKKLEAEGKMKDAEELKQQQAKYLKELFFINIWQTILATFISSFLLIPLWLWFPNLFMFTFPFAVLGVIKQLLRIHFLV